MIFGCLLAGFFALAFATSSLILSSFDRLKDSDTIHSHLMQSDGSIKVETASGMLNINLVGDKLIVSPLAPTILVAAFNEDQLANSVAEQQRGELIVQLWSGSQVIIVADPHPNPQMAMLRAAIQAQLVCTRTEFLQLADLHDSPRRAMISATVESRPNSLMIRKIKDCWDAGGREYRSPRQLVAIALAAACLFGLAVLLTFGIIYAIQHQPPKYAYNGVGAYAQGTKLMCVTVRANTLKEGETKFSQCMESFNGWVFAFPVEDPQLYHCNTTRSC